MSKLSQKSEEILRMVVDEYVDSAQPVGSQYIFDKYGFPSSPATIRNIMAELELDGYLTHPHTSAGRIPTEIGFRYWLENFFNSAKLGESEKNALDNASLKTREQVKDSAKILQQLSNLAILVGFGKSDVYYTGLSALLAQPEFTERDLVLNISNIIDELDDRVFRLYQIIDSGKPKIIIGKENPLGSLCGLVAKKFSSTPNLLIGILGPMRMDYGKNYSLLESLEV